MVAGSVVGVAAGVTGRNQAGAKLAGNGTGVVRVSGGTGQVRAWASFPEINGIAEGLGRLWLTGVTAGQNHLLYAVDPVTSRIDARVALPSRLVIIPNDVAVGAGALWVAVGPSVYRVDPASALLSGSITHSATAKSKIQRAPEELAPGESQPRAAGRIRSHEEEPPQWSIYRDMGAAAGKKEPTSRVRAPRGRAPRPRRPARPGTPGRRRPGAQG